MTGVEPAPPRRRNIALILGAALALLGGTALAVRLDRSSAPVETRARPTLALLTSLPLVFGEEFSLAGGGSPALERLERDYNVQPIGVADAASLAGKSLLLLAHPRAQPAEALVELDAWVRRGGRVVLLADPRLDWHSELPLGHRLRPPPFFADTGLLGHWGLRLDGPAVDGPHAVAVDGGEVLAVSAGRLHSAGRCGLDASRFVARCTIGRGRATVIADADFLNVAPDAIDGPTGRNLELLASELARLAPR